MATIKVYYCAYHAMSKSPKQLTNLLKRAETCIVLIVFKGVIYEVVDAHFLILHHDIADIILLLKLDVKHQSVIFYF